MNVDLKSFLEQFRFFFKNAGKYILFTSLFYALWLVKAFVLHQDFNLHSFSGRMIGIATLEGYDVGARVSMFYKCIGILIGSFTTFNLLGFFISKKLESFFNGAEIKIINYASLAGILFLLFEVLDSRIYESLELVYFAHKLMVFGILLDLLVFKLNRLTIRHYTLIVLLSTSLYFFIADCYILLAQLKNPDFLITTFIICSLLIVFLNLSFKKNKLKTGNEVRSLAYALMPLMLLPFLSVLKDEVFLVLRTNGFSLNNQIPIYLSLVILLSVIIFIRHKKTNQSTSSDLIGTHYFPLFIFSLITYVGYSYYINYSDEVFEAGNKYLPIMEFKLFGVIPTLEKFNSHLLADYFYCGIYTFFNGLQGSEMELYDFLNASFSYVIYYYLIYYLTRNAYVAAFCILLFPFTTSILPESFAFGIFSVFALNKLINKQASTKRYVLFFLAIAGLILWRIDLGYSCLVVMFFLILYYHFTSKTFKINWPVFLKALLLVLGSTIILLAVLSFYRDTNLFIKSLNALNYFTSAQTYGYSNVSDEPLIKYEQMHYFIFPVLVGIIVIALLFNFRTLNISKKQRLAYLSLLFICGFYLVNFNRGLIRHGLVEWVDHFTSSYIFIIIPASIYVFFFKNSQLFKFIAFISLSSFTLLNYKLPDPKGSTSYFEKTIEKINKTEKTNLNEIKNRVKNKPSFEEDKDAPFIEFINKNTTDKETFIDFSNNSMLYFYTKKISPSYFYQNPLCSHNDFLQNVFINDLKEYNAPYLLLSRNDNIGRDAVDNVPNTLRHYKIAEYFYQHYEPCVLTGYLRIWKAKGKKQNNEKKIVFTYHKNKNDSSSQVLNAVIQPMKGKNYYAKVTSAPSHYIDLKIYSETKSIIPHHIYINSKLSYYRIEPEGEKCGVVLQNPNQSINSFEIIECDYLPDFYSEQFLSLNFMKLPYIWGTYDKKLKDEAVLFQEKKIFEVERTKPYTLKIPSNLADSSGNTIIITCRNKSNSPQKLILSFGNSHEKEKTNIVFDVVSTKEENYALRVSSVYKWYSDTIDQLELRTESEESIIVSGIQITKEH